VRQRAIRALGEGGYQKARSALDRIAESEVHSETRRAAQAALEQLGVRVRADGPSSPAPSWQLVGAPVKEQESVEQVSEQQAIEPATSLVP
jgi:hypothetical protein